jgi:tetratricopeptide (TPR) repeat protein
MKIRNKIERRTKVKNKARILIWMGLVLLINCFLFYTWGCKRQMDKAKKHYELGVKYHQQELADQAITELQQAIKINPNYAEAHRELGVLYFEKEDYKAAFTELQQAVKINPDYAEAHFHLGVIYQVLRGHDQAVTEFEEVLKINPNFPWIHTAIGNVYYERGIKALMGAIKLDWSYLVPDTLKEISYKNKDELKKAIDNYLTTIESDTANAAAFSKLSQAYFTWAQDEYQKAIAADSSDTIAQLQMGLTFSERGYQNKAMTQYEVLKNLDPRAAEMLLQAIQQKEQEAKGLKTRGPRK